MPIKPTDSSNTLKAREYAAIALKVPNSGTEWLDQMVIEARRLDAEQFKAKLEEHEAAYTGKAAGRAKRTPASKD